ncbi:2-amino-4-hydroxy-6-hydroxymethyldihydropteridine diphosphokinase [Frigoribacterium sp. VKM Ac-1396]|uniref:2-amino-4-hydroxy-6- hydroxymethyldihydropteridine diphosphokinase n=1 Tax=Frigoribacterium sp. VKM Ac-1396 TaxID=2783821 RepID=UPI00188A12FD|nr:2-amino-4-hydroxy-6-hydroxymethyldihydropteridine diphosphokinase [Frigoribacterium sp. VKM Ac-1396]
MTGPGPAAPRQTAPRVRRRAVIALGSNLGDRDTLLREAVRAVDATPGVTVVAASAPVSSTAVTLDGPDPTKPTYLNAVLLADVTLDDEALLDALQAIEATHGRTRDVRWGDRTLDLDVVALDDERIETERLQVPHPRAAERAFVLEPWLQLDPEARLAGAGRVADLASRLTEHSRPVPGATSLLDPDPGPEPVGAPEPTPDPTPAPSPGAP